MRENNFILFPQYNILFPQLIILFPQERYKAKGSNTGKRGQDGKISEKSQTPKGKDFPRVSEIFASCPPTGVRFFVVTFIIYLLNILYFIMKYIKNTAKTRMHMDKSNIYFSNGKKKLRGKRSMECKQND
jgi:hypothetical protein